MNESEFEFGDRVKHPKYGVGFVMRHAANTVEVMFENRSYRDTQVADIELIPHPDTVRLDWLEKTFGHKVVAILDLNIEHTYRQAIDEAMQSTQSERF